MSPLRVGGERRKLQGFQYPEVFQRGLRFLIVPHWQCVYIGDASSRSARSLSAIRAYTVARAALCLVTPQLYRLSQLGYLCIHCWNSRILCFTSNHTTLSTSCVVTTRGHVCALSGNLSRILANGGLCASWQKQLWPKGIALRGCAAAHETSERAPSDVLQ